MINISEQDYYSDEANYGNYQYVELSDVLNNFMAVYVGDDKLINNVDKHVILFHLKRGLQELNYDALKEVRTVALEIDENLTFVLPQNYVNYVRISWIDDNGRFRPIIQNVNSKIATAYLQDNEFNILFDGQGNALTADTDNVTLDLFEGDINGEDITDENYNIGANFALDTSKANINGAFTINKRAGVINFSSDMENREVVLEYISDGLEYSDSTDIKINKLAVQALYMYVVWAILDSKIGIQEYVVRRARKNFISARKTAKHRIGGFRYDELLQTLRGKNKWIK